MCKRMFPHTHQSNKRTKGEGETMRAEIKKWGNSQGIRLPVQLLKEVHLNIGDPVHIITEKETVIIKPVRKNPRGRHDLKKLMAAFPKDYEPQEFDWGKPQGKEEW